MKKTLILQFIFALWHFSFSQTLSLSGHYNEYKRTLLNGEDGSKYTFKQKPFRPSLEFDFRPDSNVIIIKDGGFSQKNYYNLNLDTLKIKIPIKKQGTTDTIYYLYTVKKQNDELILNEFKLGLSEKFYLKKFYFKKGNSINIDKDTSKTIDVYTIVEEMPEFPGGTTEMYKFVAKEINYPKNVKDAKNIEKVFLKLLIGTDGTITDVEILSNPRLEFVYEAMNLIRKFPAFNPGKIKGENVNVYYNIPISFNKK